MKLVIMFAIIVAIISAVFNKNCFDVDCSGATNKCCKKSNGKKGFVGDCVKKLDSCKSGWEAARRRF
jgi:hypothetical protein